MEFVAEIDIMPHKELLDPQGKAVASGLRNLKMDNVESVRVGKHITLTLEADSEDKAKEDVEAACKKLLANPIMESYVYSIKASS